MIFFRLLEPLGTDFLVYFEAAKSILAGANPYHWEKFAGFPFNYPPTSLLFLWPLGLMPFNVAAVVWNIASLAALLLSILLVYKLAQKREILGLARMTAGVIFFFFIFTIPFFPTKFNFGMGQINNFVLLFSVLGITSPFFLAFATGIKFAPGIFLLYYFLRRDWRGIGKYFFYLLLLIIVSLILVPSEFQNEYFSNVLPMSFTGAAKDWYYNQSLYGFLARTISNETVVKFLFYGLATVIVGVTILRGRKMMRLGKSGELGVLGAVSSLYLLIHPIALQHYFGFSIIALIILGLSPGTVAAYLLLAANIKQPELIPHGLNVILSHQFFGILLLWAMALKITKPVWVATIFLVYVFSLINTGLSR